MRLLMQPNRIENVQQKTEDQKPNNDKQKKNEMNWKHTANELYWIVYEIFYYRIELINSLTKCIFCFMHIFRLQQRQPHHRTVPTTTTTTTTTVI